MASNEDDYDAFILDDNDPLVAWLHKYPSHLYHPSLTVAVLLSPETMSDRHIDGLIAHRMRYSWMNKRPLA